MAKDSTLFVGLDVHKETIAVAYVAEERGAEVVSLGMIGTRQRDIDTLIRKLQSKGKTLHFVYEAGPCGYWLYRYPHEKAPDVLGGGSVLYSQEGRRPGQDRSPGCSSIGPVITVRGSQPSIYSSVEDEAIRDVVRAREDVLKDLKAAKVRLKAFYCARTFAMKAGRIGRRPICGGWPMWSAPALPNRSSFRSMSGRWPSRPTGSSAWKPNCSLWCRAGAVSGRRSHPSPARRTIPRRRHPDCRVGRSHALCHPPAAHELPRPRPQ